MSQQTELITDKKTGILVNSEDSEQLLSEINELLKNQEKSKKIANEGYDFVIKNLTWEVLLPKYVKFYENLVNV